MIGSKCRHKTTGHIGKITLELKANKSFPAQWGIYWFGGCEGYAEQIKEKGVQYFWQDQDNIEIIKEKL